jgi:hypothetical protein
MTLELTTTNLGAMIYHLSRGEDNCGLSRDALGKFLDHLRDTIARLTAERDALAARVRELEHELALLENGLANAH